MNRRVQVGDSTIETRGPHQTLTDLPGGGRVLMTAAPEDPEGLASAERVGYGSDVARMVRERHIMHSVLAEARGLPASPALIAQAYGEHFLDAEGRATEEGEVDAILAWLNAVNGEVPHLRRLSQTLDMRKLHRRATEVIAALTPGGR